MAMYGLDLVTALGPVGGLAKAPGIGYNVPKLGLRPTGTVSFMAPSVEPTLGISVSQPATVPSGQQRISLLDLYPTHYPNKSQKDMQWLLNNIREHGIKESIKFVEHEGRNMIVDGHHRYYGGRRLGLQDAPVEQVFLPYRGYRNAQDLYLVEGRMPSYWSA